MKKGATMSSPETITTMEFEEAEKILGVGHNYNIKHVLKCFEIVHWTKRENDEKESIPNVILAKNIILQKLIKDQKKKFRFFTIDSPFHKTCPRCHGAGEIYKFVKKEVQVNCHICGGTGTLKEKCPTCKGTGRFVKRWKGGGGINVRCTRCDGSGKISIKCTNENCEEGKISKEVLTHELESTTPCFKCKQLGYLTSHPKKKSKFKNKRQARKKKEVKTVPFSPLITEQLAEKIKEGLPSE